MPALSSAKVRSCPVKRQNDPEKADNRRLKCDRELPCGNCTKRQQIDTCIYAAASVKSGPSNRDAVKMRVRKLEEKIRDLQQELRAHGLSQSDERPSGLQRQEATCIQSQQVHKSPTPLNWEAILGDVSSGSFWI